MSRTREREKVSSVFIVQRSLFLRYHTHSIGRFTLTHTRRLRKNRHREDISGELLFRPYFLRISRSAYDSAIRKPSWILARDNGLSRAEKAVRSACLDAQARKMWRRMPLRVVEKGRTLGFIRN